MTTPCPDVGPPYSSWSQIVAAQIDNPDYLPDADDPLDPCQQPDNPCCIPKYPENVAWRLEYSEDQGVSYVAHIAIHGGDLDPPTSQLAAEAAGTGGYYSMYSMTGNDDLRLAPEDFDEPQGTTLTLAANRTVSWLGTPDREPYVGQPVTFIGGLDDQLIELIREELTRDGFLVVAAPADIDGRDPDNITNRNRIGQGVQLVLSLTQRRAFYLDGDLTEESISNPANRTPVFAAYVAAVVRGIARLNEPPPVPGLPTGGENYLGCASAYSAAIHWRGGARMYIPPNALEPSLSTVTWERRLNETSSAQIVVGKRSLDPTCCEQMGEIHPWCHELTIYRDGQLVWQGPVITVTETLTEITIDAQDVTAWLSRLVNSVRLNWSRRQGSQTVPVPVDLATVADKAIRDNLTNSLARPGPDWPNILPYLTITQTGINTRMQRAVAWVETIQEILDTMVPKGLEYTTVGRRLVIGPAKNEEDVSRARLTEIDIPGGVSIVRDGTDAVTRVWATTQQEGRDGNTVTVEVPPEYQVCGRLDLLVRNSDRVDLETEEEEADRHQALRDARDQDIADIRARYNRWINNQPDTTAGRAEKERLRNERDNRIEARRDQYERELEASDDAIRDQQLEILAEILTIEANNELAGRWSVPMSINVSDNARLSPTAPIRLYELVPGEKIDVATEGFCQRLARAMRLETVTGRWTQMGEEIGVTIVPLKVPIEEYGITG